MKILILSLSYVVFGYLFNKLGDILVDNWRNKRSVL